MADIKDRVFLRPMTSTFVRINRQTTSELSPEITGSYGRFRGDIPVSISVTVDGNSYPATVNPDGTWSIAQGVISPDLVSGTTYDVTAIATYPSGDTVADRTVDELTIEAPLVAYEAGPNTDIAYGSSTTGTAYGFNL